ncbi:MAG: SLBB domain-containing protein [Sterolibacterium sp.]|jgi:protein involved in polysaccharide export with SLBB domain
MILDQQRLKRIVKSGDIISVQGMVPELATHVTLRGNVARPGRMAWRSGMRISDVITGKSLLISPDSVRRRDEVLLDVFDRERRARDRARVPSDLVDVRRTARLAKLEMDQELKDRGQPAGMAKEEVALSAQDELAITTQRTEPQANGSGDPRRLSVLSEGTSLVDRIGDLIDEVNLDYAVIERIRREDLRVSVIPFNLGRVLASVSDPDNLLLEPGDIVTVFSVKDLRVPIAKRRVFVRLEGEVNKPGGYPVRPGENLVHMIEKAGGITSDAYLFGMSLFREDVKRNQQENLKKILRQVEPASMSSLSQASQSMGGSSDASALQVKVQSLEQARRQAIERMRSFKPRF